MKGITIDNLTFGYAGARPIFNGVSQSLFTDGEKGSTTAIMGSSGVGKTTLLKLLMGILPPKSGTVTCSPKKAVFSYVPQEAVLFEHLDPLQNARYLSYASEHRHRFDEKLFQRLTHLLDMSEVFVSGNKVTRLSGGQRQRLSLLRALSIRPDILVLDEPCTGLDADVKFTFLCKLRELTEELGILTLYVTHHMDEATFIADEVVFLSRDLVTDTVENMSRQSTGEFMASPPSLDAHRIVNFPEINLLSVHRDMEGGIRLSAEPNAFVAVNLDSVVIEEHGKEFLLHSIFRTGKHTAYTHELSGSTILLPHHLTNSQTVSVTFGGMLSMYSLDGSFQGQIEGLRLCE
jgi:ABC-type multidrug transport system ATPase subunit